MTEPLKHIAQNTLSIILSTDQHWTIGYQGKIPWHLPADLRHFRETTMGHPIIMGRRTFESIGRLLDGRTNIVITSQNTLTKGAIIAKSFDEAVRIAKTSPGGDTEIFAIGGRKVYEEALRLANRLYLTKVFGVFPGDTFCPKINFGEWNEVVRKKKNADGKNAFPMEFIVYEK